MIEVGYERRDRIAYITLNRPEAKNAVTPEMHDELCRLWANFRDDDQADVAILTGVDDAFCAGADLATYVPRNYVDAPPSRVREIVDLGFGGLTRGLHRITKPTIAAVNGWALAGGCGLATACDIVIAAESARFGYPEVKIGFVPAMVMAILRRNIGEKIAFELSTQGFEFSAERALELGLVNHVYDDNEFDQRVAEYVSVYTKVSSSAERLTKQLLYKMDGSNFEKAVLAGAETNAEARMTDDCKKGTAKFLEK